MFNSYEIFYDRTRKMWPFNTGDCLIEVTTWAGLTVTVFTCMYNKTLLWQSQNEQWFSFIIIETSI